MVRPTVEPARSVKAILFSFDGRIPRRTFWLWSIVATFAFTGLVGLSLALGENEGPLQVLAFIIGAPAAVLGVWSGLAIRVKRWHDHGKSGAWVLIGMIPYIGELISFIYLGCLRGTEGHNRYGADPT